MPLQIDLRSAVLALSDALDLVGVDDFQHGKRVAMIARKSAILLGLPEARLDNLACACLLHDVGVSSTALHQRMVHGPESGDRHLHCERGYELLLPFAHLSLLAEAIRYHHTPWAELPSGLGEADAVDSNLIFLADRVDTLLLREGLANPLLHKESICAEIETLAGRELAPEVARAFLGAAASEAFWISLVPRHVQTFIDELPLANWQVSIEFPQLRHVARLVSSIVDAKSQFTAAHSIGVAQLSRHLAGRMGFNADSLVQVEIAGLMHDVGKLCVPDEIIEKPARLTRLEFSVMERHSFETYQILRHIPGLETIAEWAAFHHEALNGHGYPFRHKGGLLSREARIVAVADVFQALAQERPYRGAQPAEEILGILERFVANGVLDGDVVAVASQDFDASWLAATQPL